MKQEYKSISQWIAEGKSVADLIGYVDHRGLVVSEISVNASGTTVMVAHADAVKVTGDAHQVAPPAPKRLSDEELLRQYSQACVGHTLDTASDLRSQILDRMKAKGPTRGEVETALKIYLSRKHSAEMSGSWSPPGWEAKAREDFLSMFPEGEE